MPIVEPDVPSPHEMAGVLGRPVRFQEVSGDAYKDTLMGYGLSEMWGQGIIDRQLRTQASTMPRLTPYRLLAAPLAKAGAAKVLKPAVG